MLFASLPAGAQNSSVASPLAAPVSLPESAPAVVSAPDAAATLPEPPPAGPAVSAAPAAVPRSSVDHSVSGIKSVLFTGDEIVKIRRALEIYRRSLQPVATVAPVQAKEEEDFLSKIARNLQNTAAQSGTPGTPQAPKQFDYPRFYMESMILYSANNWTVWMSGKKYTTFKPTQGEITVKEFGTTSVTFSWKPLDMLPLIEVYNKNTEQHANVKLDEIAAEVQFTLSPNQTFYSDRMMIVEGKYTLPPVAPSLSPPAEAEKKQDQAGAATPPADAAAGATPPTPAPADAQHQGLKGLQNVYEGQIQQNIKAAQ